MFKDKPKPQSTPHVLLALIGGMVVFSILCIAAWYNLRGEFNVSRRQDFTRGALNILSDEVEAYHEIEGKYPHQLEDVPFDRNEWLDPNVIVSWSWCLSTDPPVDYWGHPMQYELEDTTYKLYSLGRDGSAGGIGLDADLYLDGRNREKSLPTFWQFYRSSDVDSGGFVIAGILAGIAVTCMILVSLQLPKLSNQRTDMLMLILYSLVIIWISTVVGIMLLPSHIPVIERH